MPLTLPVQRATFRADFGKGFQPCFSKYRKVAFPGAAFSITCLRMDGDANDPIRGILHPGKQKGEPMILQETGPLILLKKYRSILLSSLSVEAVVYAASLTDSIIAGNLIETEAFSAISLFAPLTFASSFVASIVNSGTLFNYNRKIGQFEKRRADEIFSQGIVMALLLGALSTLIALLVKPIILSAASASPKITGYLDRYYPAASFYLFLFPVSCILSNIVIADGGEKRSAVSDISCIMLNILLSLALAGPYGVMGIAAATLISKIAYLGLICSWFFSQKNTVHFVFHFSREDFFSIIGKGIVRASKYIITAAMIWIINLFILSECDGRTFQIWAVCQNITGLSAFFLGIAMTLQPFMGTLLSEGNTKAAGILVKRLSRDMGIIGAVCTLLFLAFPAAALELFGIRDGAVIAQGVAAVRIMSLGIVFSAQLTLFFVYYYLIGKSKLAIAVSLTSDLLLPVGTALLLWKISGGDPVCIWIGLTGSGFLSVLVLSGVILGRYGRGKYPLLFSGERDRDIYIYAFLTEDGMSSAASETALRLLRGKNISDRLLPGVCMEELINLIRQQNDGKPVLVECTLIAEQNGLRMVFRDDGLRLNITGETAGQYSFLKYIADSVMTAAAYTSYIVTAGYNRNELFFANHRGQEAT